jgi:hypothetical protein
MTRLVLDHFSAFLQTCKQEAQEANWSLSLVLPRDMLVDNLVELFFQPVNID